MKKLILSFFAIALLLNVQAQKKRSNTKFKAPKIVKTQKVVNSFNETEPAPEPPPAPPPPPPIPQKDLPPAPPPPPKAPESPVVEKEI
jgi:hypothetical protein